MSITFAFPASRHFATAWRISRGARNCPFFTETLFPCLAQARTRSVCRQRKAGTCRRSTTLPAGSACQGSWTSVVQGSPVSRFTAWNAASPTSSPGPRKLLPDERFALSKLALNTTGRPCFAASAFTLRAWARAWPSDSITHGPAMRRSFLPSPTSCPAIRASTASTSSFPSGRAARALSLAVLADRELRHRGAGPALRLVAVPARRRDEPGEERVGRERLRLELRVKLAAHEVRVVVELDHLDEVQVRVHAREDHPGLLVLRAVRVVELEAVAVALLDELGAVKLSRLRPVPERAGVAPEPHRPALVCDPLLALHERDDRVRGLVVELERVRPVEAEHGPPELDDGHLEPEADAEERDLLLPRPAGGEDLPLRAAHAEAAGHEDPVHLVELGQVALLELRRVDEDHPDADVRRDPAVRERLVEALVALVQLDVLADDADADLAELRGLHLLDDGLPPLEARRAAPDVEQLGELVVEPLAVERERHLVDRGDVERGEHRRGVHVAEERDLVLHLPRDLAVGAAEQDVRLDADLPQLLHRVLRRLRLELSRGGDVRHEREVDVERVLLADVVLHLPDRLEERERLDVADRAAHLDDEDVRAARRLADDRLDLVGDVGNDLDGLPEILAAPLALDDGLVDAPGRVIVLPGHLRAREALVVAEVEVRLRAVVGDVDLAVLERAHRARVHVDVRVELQVRHLEAAVLEERADGRRGEPLAERAHHATRDEHVLRLLAPLDHGPPPSLVMLRREDRPSALEVLRRVDAEPRIARVGDPDPVPVLERAELLERLLGLEPPRRERGELLKERRGERVDAHVCAGERAVAPRPAVRDGGAREVERVALEVGDHL